MRHVFFTLSILLLLPSGRQPATARPTVAATVPTLRISRTADAGIFAKTAQPGLPEAADRTTAPADRTTGRVTGCVVDLKTGAAVCGAVVGAGDGTLWTSTDREGRFVLERVGRGEVALRVGCLGYVTREQTVRPGAEALRIELQGSSLAIDEVVVTARRDDRAAGTSYSVGREALDHLQWVAVTDLAALLPGGKSVNSDLTAARTFSLCDGGESAGNAAFATAAEVDGVRLGNNASFASPSGVQTRGLTVGDVESVEVLTGVPSAEYGDMGSGMVRIRTRKGITPWNITLSTNPRTWLFSLAKGFRLGSGTLNVSGEWTRATQKLSSPYTSYTRRGLTATYTGTFRRSWHFEAGLAGTVGGMDSREDPDAFTGAYSRGRDHALRAHSTLTWMVNRPGITQLRLEASAALHDERTYDYDYHTAASEQPAAHAPEEGYHLADRLPFTYFSGRVADSKEVDIAAALKYSWVWHRDRLQSRLSAGVQWKSTGNAGRGEYYDDPALAPSGYRPRPYGDYPRMHNLSAYLEESLTLPVGTTGLTLTAGARMESLLLRGSRYRHTTILSPRLNLRWRLADRLTLRGGWGTTGKLPSYWILYPRQEYRDVQTFGFPMEGNGSAYVYYSQPYTMQRNDGLRWQRNRNAEAAVEWRAGGFRLTLSLWRQTTLDPYRYAGCYEPFSYTILQLPEGYTVPARPEVKVDRQTGMVWMRGGSEEYWTPMEVRVTDRTFVRTVRPENGAKVRRQGLELILESPELRPLRTTLRLDAAWTSMHYVDAGLTASYRAGWSHPALPDRSYPYVGLYADGGSASVVNGCRTRTLDVNLTAITRIPQARLVITCRLELALERRRQNLSLLDGRPYAQPVGDEGYTAIRPVAWMDLDGIRHPFTDAEAADPAFAGLILQSNNIHTFDPDGYDPYMSANFSLTKEIGNHVSLSFYANNFTRSRREVRSWATGVGAIFTPDFYYGLTCRIKF